MTNIAEQLLANCVPEPNCGCWLWLGTINQDGYGVMRHDGRTQGAHRVSYEIFRGPITDGLFVCHRYDVRSCINPDHFFLGTHRENMEDKARKGRGRGRGAGKGRYRKHIADDDDPRQPPDDWWGIHVNVPNLTIDQMRPLYQAGWTLADFSLEYLIRESAAMYAEWKRRRGIADQEDVGP